VFLMLLTLHVVVQLAQNHWHTSGAFDQIGLGRWLPGGKTWIPLTHGYLYLAYVVIAVDLWFRTRLPAGKMLLVVAAGTVPGMSFVAERWVTHRVTPMLPAADGAELPAPTGQ